MGLSLIFLGLIVLMNSLFVANYLIVRSLRLSIETAKLLKKQCGDEDIDEDEDEPLPFKERMLKHPLVRKLLVFLFGPIIMLYFRFKDNLEKAEEEARESGKTYTGLDEKLAFVGYMRKERLAERSFPGWKRIPFNAGALTTTILVVLFSVLFSEKILNNAFGLDTSGTNPQSNMCTRGNIDAKLDLIINDLRDSTNYVDAKRQLRFTANYRDALQNDTHRYGEEGYECENYPRTKEEFANTDNVTLALNLGSGFFPGMCEMAQEFALNTARNQVCEQEFCNMGEVVDQSSITAENGLIDWDSLEYDVSGSLHIPTPKIKYEKSGVKNAWNGLTGQYEKIATIEGFENEHTIGNDDVDVTIDEDSLKQGEATASYGFVNMSFCDTYIIPCPDFSKYDEISDAVKDYSKEKLQTAFDHTAEFAAPAVQELNVVVDEGVQALARLMITQMEIASYIYVAYTCLTLFFPSPLVIFREHFLIALRQFVFGAGKYTFILMCLAIWWGVQYFKTFAIYTEFSVYMNMFFQDPCLGDSSYVTELWGNFTYICSTMVETKANFTMEHQNTLNIVDMVEPMTDCCGINYPYESLREIMPDASHQELMDSFGFLFDTSTDNLCGGAGCFLPDMNATYIGNMTVCEDNNFLRTSILHLLENSSDVNWWDIWISTGLLASIILKGCVANFGIALVQLADPFMQCDGKYVGPPKDFNFGKKEMDNLIAKSEHLLRVKAVGKVFFWGAFVNLVILNVILGTERDEIGDEEEMDQDNATKEAVIGAFLIFISLIPIAISGYAYYLMQQKYMVLLQKVESRRNGADSDDEFNDDLPSEASESFETTFSDSAEECDADVES